MELKVQKLSKAFGSQSALKNVSLELTSGCVAILGPNGSGKTTLLRCLAALVRPDSGHLWFDGLPYEQNVQLIRGRVGYLPQELHLPDHLSGRKILNYFAVLKESNASEQVEDLIVTLGLQKVADRPISSLSYGEIRLFGIAQALLGNPQLILLDEPTRGLDVKERGKVFSLLRRYLSECLILYTTHDVEDVTRMADRVIILYEGEVVFFKAVKDLHFSARNEQESYSRIADIGRFLDTVVRQRIRRNKDAVMFG